MGLDASTETIGISVVKYNDTKTELEYYDFYKPPKKGNIIERLAQVRQFILRLIEEQNPDEVALEDIILYMRYSTARTTTILSALNRTVGVAIYDKLGKSPYLYDVNFIRRTIKLKSSSPKKEEIPDVVSEILGIKFPYVLNRQKNIAKENFDIADSIAAALCYIEIERNGLSHVPQKKIKKKSKKKKKISKKK
jgi:Holliday junction resolvasome RuvABC endonuclease subunit